MTSIGRGPARLRALSDRLRPGACYAVLRHAHREDKLAEVEDDVERVLVDDLQMRELVEPTFDLGPGSPKPLPRYTQT